VTVGDIVSVVSRISVSVRIVSIVTVAEERWVVSDVEGGRAFDVDHFPFLQACDCAQSVFQPLVENARRIVIFLRGRREEQCAFVYLLFGPVWAL